MPTPTDTLADEIRETNHRLADITQQLGALRTDVAKEFGALRTDMAQQFGALNANLEGFRGRTETSLSAAVWTIRIVVPIIAMIVISLVAWSYSAYARAVRLEDSIVELREHSKDVDGRISRLVELMSVSRVPLTTPKGATHE
jgi:hypothetical protein